MAANTGKLLRPSWPACKRIQVMNPPSYYFLSSAEFWDAFNSMECPTHRGAMERKSFAVDGMAPSRPTRALVSGMNDPSLCCQTEPKITSAGVSYKYWYPDEAMTQYLYETYPDVSFVPSTEVDFGEIAPASWPHLRGANSCSGFRVMHVDVRPL